jgi:Cell division protein CrgA
MAVPESRQRKKAGFTPPPSSKKAVRVGGRRWVAPAMLTCWIVGLAWIVLYYLAPDLPYMRDISSWNLAIGMALIAVGFVLATKWE